LEEESMLERGNISRRTLLSALGAGGAGLLLPGVLSAQEKEKNSDREQPKLSPTTGVIDPKQLTGGPDSKKRIVTVKLQLPKNLKPGVYENGRLVIPEPKGNPLFSIWGVIGILGSGQLGGFHFTGVPGINPVGASFVEWDAASNNPHFGDALMHLVEVVRRPGEARVHGFQNFGTLLCAVGCIVEI
jgi:hypothetical protein